MQRKRKDSEEELRDSPSVREPASCVALYSQLEVTGGDKVLMNVHCIQLRDTPQGTANVSSKDHTISMHVTCISYMGGGYRTPLSDYVCTVCEL